MRWLSITVEKHRAVYTPSIMLLAFIVGISYMGLGFVMPLQTLYGRQIGATSTEIGLLAAAPLLTGFLVAPLIGHGIDHFGCRAVLWSGLSLHAFLFLAYVFVHIPTWLIVLRATEGIAIVCILPPARSLINTLAPNTRQGEALGLLSATQMGGTLIGPLCGTLLASQVGFVPSFLCAALLLGLSALVARFFLPRQASLTSLKTTIVGSQSLSKDLFTRPLILA
jgi:MFS family permease